ncbi:MAG: rane protein [Paenibacillus sp.]|nr:rane protein [Paenibacillus sp.]
MMLYKFMHILGAMLFLGNIVTAAFWKVRADYGSDYKVLHQAARNVMLADYIFTAPGIVILAVFGHLTAIELGYPIWETGWLAVSYVLFILSGIIWLGILVPAQLQMVRYTKTAADTGLMPRENKRWTLIWNVFGTINVLIPIVIVYFMVVKPF